MKKYKSVFSTQNFAIIYIVIRMYSHIYQYSLVERYGFS